MKKLLFVSFLFCLFSSSAQYWENDTTSKIKSTKPFKERLYVGGRADLFFANNYGLFGLGPLVGYKITENLSAGINSTIRYSVNGNNNRSGWEFGAGPFARCVFSPVLLHGELEMMNHPETSAFSTAKRRFTPMAWLGLGFIQGDEDNYMYFLFKYDFIDDPASPYRNFYLVNDFPLVYEAGIVISLG